MASEAAGRRTAKVVPSPGTDRTAISPRCCSTIPWATANPSPTPEPSLVEKKGSKIRFKISVAMPAPVSATVTSTHSGGSTDWPGARWVASVRCPPCGMASTAFKIRFVSISRSSEAFPATDGTG